MVLSQRTPRRSKGNILLREERRDLLYWPNFRGHTIGKFNFHQGWTSDWLPQHSSLYLTISLTQKDSFGMIKRPKPNHLSGLALFVYNYIVLKIVSATNVL